MTYTVAHFTFTADPGIAPGMTPDTLIDYEAKRLSRFPRSGAVILEFPDLPYREIYVKPYRFFYRVREDNVWIVALWHGAQLPDEPEHA